MTSCVKAALVPRGSVTDKLFGILAGGQVKLYDPEPRDTCDDCFDDGRDNLELWERRELSDEVGRLFAEHAVVDGQFRASAGSDVMVVFYQDPSEFYRDNAE